MPTNNMFAEEFLRLLKQSGFPDEELKPDDILRQTHAIVTALNNQVMKKIGTQLTILDIASQGLKGPGGGPHRLDLLLHYSLTANRETMENTQGLLQKFSLSI